MPRVRKRNTPSRGTDKLEVYPTSESVAEANGLGLPDITLRRAKSALGVTALAEPTDKGKQWFCRLKRIA